MNLLNKADKESCPCGSGKYRSVCCEPFIQRQKQPETAEQLMCSRFTAFCLADGQYLYDTHHPEFRVGNTAEEYRAAAHEAIWRKLEILNARGGPSEHKGTVEFKAYFLKQGMQQVMHERSRFVKESGRWLYTKGVFPDSPPKRNAPCPCGSGKKFKHCCSK